MADGEVVCKSCGETASGPGAKAAMQRHRAQKHPKPVKE